MYLYLQLNHFCSVIIVLFKQGQTGQAFYIILSGSAHVHVNSPTEEGATIIVNTLGPGSAFGERALESSNSIRMATIVIGDTAELLVITKNDYCNIVAEMKVREKTEKIDLLKTSHCFRHLSSRSMEEIIKYMEPRLYSLDKLVYRQRTKATEIIIINKGEVQIEVELEELDGSKHDVVLGRLGPAGVLADYITQCTSFIQDQQYKEKVTSMSLTSVFVINKYDVFNHLTADARLEMARAVLDGYLKPPPTTLFDNVVQKFGEHEWRIYKSWKIFKKESTKNLGGNIIDTYKTMENTFLAKESNGNLPPIPQRNDASVMSLSKFHEEHKEQVPAKPATSVAVKGEGGKRTGEHHEGGAEYNGSGKPKAKVAVAVLTGPLLDFSSYAFVLVQYHREIIKMKATHISNVTRFTSTYMQICGAMRSTEEAQMAADSHMLNLKIINYSFDHHKLQWRPFVDFDCVPMQHSDHFVVYCRSAPVAIASYTPNINIMETEFPEACKPKGQRFSCSFFSRIHAADNHFVAPESLPNLSVCEMQSFVELHEITSCQVDCLRRSKVTVPSSSCDTRLAVFTIPCCVVRLCMYTS